MAFAKSNLYRSKGGFLQSKGLVFFVQHDILSITPLEMV